MIRLRASAAAFTVLACAAQAPLAPLPQAPSPGALPGPTTPFSPAKATPVAASVPAASNTTPLASVPAPRATPPSLGDIGSAGPVKLLATSPSGAWVALCDGEPSTAKLVLGSGTGEAIDDVLAQDASGRYLVAAQGGAAVLFDAALGTRVNLSELGADVRRVRADYAEHRTLSFDPSGRYLAYLRGSGATSSVVTRALETGAERVSAAVGEVFRLKLSADARYVVLDALREDTSHNGKLDWPAPEEAARPNACDRPALPKFRSFGYQGRGDALTRAVVTLETGALRDVPQLVTTLGSSLLVRESDGSLQLEQAGKRTPLAPASCGGRVLFADAERGLVLATCAPPPPKKKKNSVATPTPGGKREVWLFGASYSKNLQSELYETSIDRDSVTGVRLVPLYPGSEAGVLDLERRELLPLATGSRVLVTNGALALVWRDSDLYRYDAAAKTEQRLARGVLKTPELLQTGSTVLLSPFVVVGIEGPALASPAQPLALSSSGFVLTGATAAPSAESPPSAAPGRSALRGPLHWTDAKLPADAKVPPPDGSPR